MPAILLQRSIAGGEGAGARFLVLIAQNASRLGGTMREQSPDSDDFDLTDPAGYRHWTTITIRYRDLDPLGHINNSVYSEWFEAARVLLTRSFSAAGPDWLLTALARMTINFLAE